MSHHNVIDFHSVLKKRKKGQNVEHAYAHMLSVTEEAIEGCSASPVLKTLHAFRDWLLTEFAKPPHQRSEDADYAHWQEKVNAVFQQDITHSFIKLFTLHYRMLMKSRRMVIIMRWVYVHTPTEKEAAAKQNLTVWLDRYAASLKVLLKSLDDMKTKLGAEITENITTFETWLVGDMTKDFDAQSSLRTYRHWGHHIHLLLIESIHPRFFSLGTRLYWVLLGWRYRHAPVGA